ncbi:hypothetical protein IMY05_C4347000800 [Salix suchowensis]|nr:hypothetical protein IMY05_C4347000800 [Salix suchowensis]
MPPKRKRAIEVSRSEGSNNLRRSTPEPVHDVVRSIHRSTTGRINQSVRMRQRNVVVDDESNGEDDLEPDAMTEDYIHDASTADFIDDDNIIPVLDDLGNIELDEGDDLTLTSLMEWMPYRQSFLDELHRLDGRCGQTSGQCDECNAPTRTIGARIASTSPRTVADAYSRDTSLCLSIGSRSSLASIGLVIDLGHHGTQCEFTYEIQSVSSSTQQASIMSMFDFVRVVPPLRTPYNSSVSSGFRRLSRNPHTVHVHCSRSISFAYAAKCEIISQCLNHPNDASDTCKSCYEQFLLSMRIWRHLKITKRAGCGLNPAGVEATAHGECAVECPCVHIQRRTSQRTGRPRPRKHGVPYSI